jgi:nucleotide-binding universal stress UspA family protein
MKQFNNILICGHPDHIDMKLLEHAADIAASNKANVKVIHVITDYPKDVRTWWNVRNPGKLREKIISEREDFLDGLVENLIKLGVENATRKLLWGEPIVEIAKETLHQNYDMLMMVSKHKGKASYGALGHASSDLIRQCPCPIWVTKKKVKRRVHSIVACLGGSAGEIKLEDTNAKILDHAAAIAKAEHSELHIVHVMPPYGSEKKSNKDEINSDLAAFLDHVRDSIKTPCNRFLADYDMSVNDAQIHLLIGPPATTIPEFVESKGADLVVMATAAYTGLSSLIVGNTAEKVLKRINSPLLVVKSDAFSAQFNLAQQLNSTVA